MPTSHVRYLGGLRTEARHISSGLTLITDAPPDNQGRGEAFSPTDLMSTSLACCMMTIIGIRAREGNYPLRSLDATVTKHMASAPRRVARIEVDIRLSGDGLDASARAELEEAARTCPVALSLREGLVQEMRFHYT
ncbi:MAG: OsmC family protein [Flavobacteriales bacterium]|nr:OsmC family protein [Flavobacteriales bacterium]MCB9166003.1 OsmC family protein [Flavobacteriales bacterium]